MFKYKILYYTGETAERWGPLSLKTGIGGSQTAVINLSEIWSSLGYDVTVCANIPTKKILHRKVKYINYRDYKNKETFDVAILWREPSYLNLGIKAKKFFLDLHDVPEKLEYTSDVYQKIDKIFLKSAYQKSLFGQCEYKDFIIIPNGIASNLLKKKNKNRDPYRLIYASDYYRGLEQMLLYGWPLIKKMIPQMTLDIYYGWNFFDKANYGNEERFLWKQKIVNLIKNSQALEHGRIGQKELTEEMLGASILYYGCTFPEIDCIVTRQAAAVGCIPFTSDFGALKEKSYCVTSPGDFSTKEAQINLAQLIINSVKNKHILTPTIDKDINKIRHEFIQKASEETWNNIGKEWTRYF